jgi:uncharacterized protein YdeI (YjbR/CyaY-like superfamily)
VAKRAVSRGAPGLTPNEDLRVKDRAAWERWLAAHHTDSAGVWLVLAKKGSNISTPTYQEALAVALCFGWIDGKKGARDAATWAQRFGPRGPKSIWSKINVGKAEALIAMGQMKPAGLAAIEAARKDGSWAAAYASQKVAGMPEDLQAALDASPSAGAFFTTLSSANRYAILFRIHTAKNVEKRRERIAHFIEMLERRETVHPQRR